MRRSTVPRRRGAARLVRTAYDRSVTIFAAIVLFVGALFNVISWPRFFQRVSTDPRARDESGRRTTFYTVHLVLVLIALTIAAASVVAGVMLLIA